MFIHVNGHTINTRNINWINQQNNVLFIQFLMQNAPLQIAYRSADEATRAHRDLLTRLVHQP